MLPFFQKEKEASLFGKPLYFMGFIKLGDDLSFGYQIFRCIFIGT
jgi:hypothetical protein